MNETRQEYLKRINLVLDFIENNLDADLSLEYLSKKVHYSAFHFHRVFLTVVNERLNEYVNRKRIERIASILITQSNPSIKNLAFEYGFKSHNSFSRAFKKYYGLSPTKFKSEGELALSKIGIELFLHDEYICSLKNIKQWINMNAQITIQQLPELRLASISDIGDFNKAGAMFERLMEWGFRNKKIDTNDFKALTIYHDNPNVTQTSKLRFSTCFSIHENIDAEGEIRQITLKGGNYIVGHLEIKAEDIPKAWRAMCIWVIDNGYNFRDADYFEMYHNDHRTHVEKKFIMDICIPIEKTINLKHDEKITLECLEDKTQKKNYEPIPNYHELLSYMKGIKTFFQREYQGLFNFGNIYKSNPDYSYFSLTTDTLKKQKLKFVIILDHQTLCFSICLSGQNKRIRKKYWEMFRKSDWNKYHLAESIDDSLIIMDKIIEHEPDFSDMNVLTKKIEKESFEFIDQITEILE